MMTLYRIRGWNDEFENNRSRTVEDLTWVALPNRHDGENYTAIVTAPHGSEIFAGWVLMVQVASRCTPRGTLLRDNRKPHDALSLSVKTRAPKVWFEKAIAFLSSDTDWLEITPLEAACHEADLISAARCQSNCQAGDEERKGREQNGKERKKVEATQRFISPTASEVSTHGKEIQLPEHECAKFVAYYESKGWMVGRHKMKSWKGALAGWRLRWLESAKPAGIDASQCGEFFGGKP